MSTNCNQMCYLARVAPSGECGRLKQIVCMGLRDGLWTRVIIRKGVKPLFPIDTFRLPIRYDAMRYDTVD